MDTIKGSFISDKQISRRLDNFRRSLSCRALPVLIVLLLLVGMVGLNTPTTALAAHEGEQTAEFLPSDTDLYLTVNLEPSLDQLNMLSGLVNYWWQDSDFQNEVGDLLSELEDKKEINLEDDVLSWLGPEVAVGMCNLVFEDQEEYVPELVVFIGTKDKQASDTFFKDQFIPLVTDETGTEGTYNGIETLYFTEDAMYCAFTDEYIVISTYQAFLESTLDMFDTDLPSLSDDTNYKQCQNALPADRVGMLYCNIEQIWDGAIAGITDLDWLGDILESLNDKIPPCFAASVSFTGNGLSMSAYCPLPDGATLPGAETDLLQNTGIVPGDALLFTSGQDANAIWEEIRSLIAENWEDLVQGLLQGLELPQEIDAFIAPFIGNFESMMSWIKSDFGLGVDIDKDIFGWMIGECSMALLSVPTTSNEFPDILIMFEVGDTNAVDGSLNDLIDGLNTVLDMQDETDSLETSDTTIDGVSATLVTNDAIGEAEASPGWLFLDVGSTHYLVIGTTSDALRGAVDASQGDIPSLDETGGYQSVLSLLPETQMSLGYFNPTQIFDLIIAEMSTEGMDEDESAVFDLITSNLPMQCALGYSTTVTADAATTSGALYLLPPAMVEQTLAEGTTGNVKISETSKDFTQDDEDVGQCAFSIDVKVKDTPATKIGATATKDENITSGFQLAATDAGLSVVDVAYVLVVSKGSLTDDDIDTATITMKVDKNWANKYDKNDIKIIRIGDDGTKEQLPTERKDDEGDKAVFVGTSVNGLSTFGLVALSATSSTNWALIGGIIGAVLFVIIVLAVIIGMRRRTA